MLGAADPNVVSGTAGGTIERARAMGGGLTARRDTGRRAGDRSLRALGLLLLAVLVIVFVVVWLAH